MTTTTHSYRHWTDKGGHVNNSSAYSTKTFAKGCSALGLKHIHPGHCTPRTNGKAERFIQTLCREGGLLEALPELCGTLPLAATLPIDL